MGRRIVQKRIGACIRKMPLNPNDKCTIIHTDKQIYMIMCTIYMVSHNVLTQIKYTLSPNAHTHTHSHTDYKQLEHTLELEEKNNNMQTKRKRTNMIKLKNEQRHFLCYKTQN